MQQTDNPSLSEARRSALLTVVGVGVLSLGIEEFLRIDRHRRCRPPLEVLSATGGKHHP
ncbi:hypothetical protein [Streptomyces lucensis]|uniref:hypothetical protein n=1 Tax=Streptomyces lucensis TaxID=67319 RepID=UPI001677831B|nr:hypothetical protein [Streptomyces lucensis]